ncbi:MAG: CDC27 family protein, partial [Planctomycetota bacterium]
WERRGEHERATALHEHAMLRSRLLEVPATYTRWMNDVAWQVVRRVGLSAEAYAAATGLAEQVVALEPESGFMVNTLGVALYRAGEHERAIEVLRRSVALSGGQGYVEDWACIAMAAHRLGRHEEAAEALETTRRLVDEAEANEESLRFLREAEAVLGQTG